MQNHEGRKKHPKTLSQSSKGWVNEWQKQRWETEKYSRIDYVLTLKIILGKKQTLVSVFKNLFKDV